MADNDNQGLPDLDAKLVEATARAKADPDARRSISVRGETYARLKAYCEANGITMSSLVERLVREHLDKSL